MKNFIEEFSRVHQAAGLEFPFNSSSAYDHIPELPELVKKQKVARQGTLDLAEQLYPDNRNLIDSLKIFNEMAPFYDRLFVAHITQISAGDHVTRSWINRDPQAALGLKQHLTGLLQNPAFAPYFQENPETTIIFQITVLKLIDERDPTRLYAISRELEERAICAHDHGRMVFLNCLSDYYTDPDRVTGSNSVPLHYEPDLRLILPVPSEHIKSVTHSGWARLKNLHPELKTPEAVPVIAGYGLGWAGAQLLSNTTAETLNTRGLVMSVNLLKHKQVKTALLSFLSVHEPESLSEITMALYVLHELGHEFYNHSEKLFLEVAADIVACIVGTEMVNHHEIPVTMDEWLLGLLIESVALARLPRMDKENEDGYRLSGIFLLNQLLAHKVVTVNSGKLQLTQEQLPVYAFILDLKRYYMQLLGQDSDILRQLRQTQATVQTTELLRLLSQPV